jgi:outer membrane protein
MLKKLLILLIAGFFFSIPIKAETVLSLEKVRYLALKNNRQYQTARKELDRSRGEIISARSGALPQLSFNSSYTRNIEKREMLLPGEIFGGSGFIKVPISQNNDFSFALSLTQPLYSGGKVGSALSIAKIYSKYSQEKVNEVEAEIVFGAEGLFYNAILAGSNLDVLKSADEQLTYNLSVVQKYFDQGMVSEYELLRARVEKLNLEPQLVAAESQVKLTRKRLKSFLGIRLDEDITLVSDYSDTTLGALPSLDSLVDMALSDRPEIKQAQLQKEGYKKAIRIAKGNWIYPNLSLNTTYSVSASSDDFKLSNREVVKGWTASLMLNIPLFDGGRTIGEVRKAKTDYYQSILAEEQASDDIRLEVEQAYDNITMARRAMESQKETIAQAEEGMRIANLRYESGVGTQLEVLSAQTALTDARKNLSKAIYDFRLAKSALRKATKYDIK